MGPTYPAIEPFCRK
ncbi:hypothetical protein [Glaciihabitans sp. dw_435]